MLISKNLYMYNCWAQNWREIGWGQQYSKTDSKKFLSKLNNEHKIWSPNYQNTTGSKKSLHWSLPVTSNCSCLVVLCSSYVFDSSLLLSLSSEFDSSIWRAQLSLGAVLSLEDRSVWFSSFFWFGSIKISHLWFGLVFWRWYIIRFPFYRMWCSRVLLLFLLLIIRGLLLLFLLCISWEKLFLVFFFFVISLAKCISRRLALPSWSGLLPR